MARKFRRKAEENEVPLDMTPMIDCIFLLLIFFILTTKFTPDEKAIASLMPTDKGQAQASSPTPVPKEQVNIKLYPQPMVKGYQPSEYRNQLQAILNERRGQAIDAVYLQVGGDNPLPVNGKNLVLKGGPEIDGEVRRYHSYIEQALAARETGAGIRKDAPPIIVHCFSRLSWKYALLAYDAVRDYERKKTGGGVITDNEKLLEAREVTFAPPRIRNYHTNEDGNEIYEIINMQ